MEHVKKGYGKNMKLLLMPLLCQITIYIIQFLIIPKIIITFYPNQYFDELLILFTTTGILSFLGMFFLSDKFQYWIIGLFVYAILIILWNPAYNLVQDGLDAWLALIILWVIVTLFEQLIVWLIVIGLKLLRNKIGRKKTMEKKELAKDLFAQGFNCSQTVFVLFAEKYGLPRETALKIGCGFGGGMREGWVCGAVTGAIMVVGLRYGHSKPEDTEAKALCYEKTKEFTQAFRKKNGSVICKDLLGVDISTPEGMNEAKDKELFKTTCVDMICDAVEVLENLGY